MKRKSIFKGLSSLLVVLFFAAIGIGGCEFVKFVNSPGEHPERGTMPINPVPYGENIYYFSATKANFGKALSAFLESNPKLEVTGIAGDGTGGRGYTVGYFVSFRIQECK